MKTLFVLLDSLNRNYLPIYGNDWVKAPNIQRLADTGIVFDNHWLGSAPCMPARRDILTGRLNFLERGWGAIEPMDIPFPRLLRDAGVRSHMETDHYHYFMWAERTITPVSIPMPFIGDRSRIPGGHTRCRLLNLNTWECGAPSMR